MFGADVQCDSAVEACCVDDQRIAFIAAGRGSHPRGFNILSELTPIGWDDVEYVIRLIKYCQTLRSLNELDRIFRLHRACVAPGKAEGRVVEFRRLIHLRS